MVFTSVHRWTLEKVIEVIRRSVHDLDLFQSFINSTRLAMTPTRKPQACLHHLVYSEDDNHFLIVNDQKFASDIARVCPKHKYQDRVLTSINNSISMISLSFY
jgi:hypothetical protein